MTAPALGYLQLLEALPPGGRLWLRAGGQSMWPLLLEGDQLLVVRCSEQVLQRGDLAVITWADQPVLVAHAVKSVGPLVTVSAVGVCDRLGAMALAKVIALRRGGRRIELPRFTPAVITSLIASGALFKHVPGVRRLVRALRPKRVR